MLFINRLCPTYLSHKAVPQSTFTRSKAASSGAPMASLELRGKRWWGKVRIPTALVDSYGGKKQLEKNLQTSDRKAAEAEAALWEAILRIEWAEQLGSPQPEKASLRAAYQSTKLLRCQYRISLNHNPCNRSRSIERHITLFSASLSSDR